MAKFKPPTLADVQVRVEAIREKVRERDAEGAYGREIDLYVDVLRAIAMAEAHPSPGALAKAALQARKIKFERYTA